MPQAIVVMRPFCEWMMSLPVFIRKNEPSPYEFFASPFEKHACPKRSACWLPIHAAIGMAAPKRVASV